MATAFGGRAEVRREDYSAIRGATYRSLAGEEEDHWGYDPKVTERELGYARKIGVTHLRVFLSYRAYTSDKDVYFKALHHLIQTCTQQGLKLMLVVANSKQVVKEPAPYPKARAWVRDLLAAVGNEPAVTCWELSNEPDYPSDRPDLESSMAYVRALAEMFRELDSRRPRTPLTIGFAQEAMMEKHANIVDVLSYHHYSPLVRMTREGIQRAQAFASKVGKPVICSEIGCMARGNPYDLAIEEYSRAGMGFYIWELMITRAMGEIHGVFYADGTVRDPAIAAAMLGIYRNRGAGVIPEFPACEGLFWQVLTEGKKWLEEKDASFDKGADWAEMAANLLEANQLVAMHDLPTRRVAQLRRKNPPDIAALRSLLEDFLGKLELYQARPPEK